MKLSRTINAFYVVVFYAHIHTHARRQASDYLLAAEIIQFYCVAY